MLAVEVYLQEAERVFLIGLLAVGVPARRNLGPVDFSWIDFLAVTVEGVDVKLLEDALALLLHFTAARDEVLRLDCRRNAPNRIEIEIGYGRM